MIEENTVIDLFLEFEGRGMGMLRRRGNSGLLRDSMTGHLINAPVRESNHLFPGRSTRGKFRSKNGHMDSRLRRSVGNIIR